MGERETRMNRLRRTSMSTKLHPFSMSVQVHVRKFHSLRCRRSTRAEKYHCSLVNWWSELAQNDRKSGNYDYLGCCCAVKRFRLKNPPVI